MKLLKIRSLGLSLCCSGNNKANSRHRGSSRVIARSLRKQISATEGEELTVLHTRDVVRYTCGWIFSRDLFGDIAGQPLGADDQRAEGTGLLKFTILAAEGIRSRSGYQKATRR